MDIKQEKSKFKISKIAHQNHIIKNMCDNGKIQYNCTACGKIFRSRSQQYYHINCNQLQQMYNCDQCSKTFTRDSHLKYHRQSHISPVNKCLKCQKIFSNPLALKKHTALHKVKPKLCPNCNKSFLKKESLEQHIAAQHLNQLQYNCANCTKKYSSKSSLHLHLQTHEKKRFECSYCGKFFYRNSVLNLHLKRHFNSSGYMCAVCHKVFSESGALIRHNKIHEENVTQYFCKLCSKRILRKDNMNRHVNTIHPEEKFDNIVEIIKPIPSNSNDNIEAAAESKKNERIVIIENKLIKEQNHAKVETDIPKNTNNEKNQQSDSPIKNQIKVITLVPSYETSKIEINYCESQNQTEKFSNLHEPYSNRREVQGFCQTSITTDKLELNFENNTPAITQDEIQKHTDYPQKTRTISSVIRSVGNVSKHLSFSNTANNKIATTNRTNSEYKHKKYCRNYNIDLYRKILGCDEENEDNQREENNNKASSDPLCNNAVNIDLKAAPVHWRKSFKTNYETSASNCR